MIDNAAMSTIYKASATTNQWKQLKTGVVIAVVGLGVGREARSQQ